MNRSRNLAMALTALVLVSTAACSGPPETQVYIVVTSTHQPPTLTALALAGQVVAEATETPTAPPATDAPTIAGSPLPVPTVNPMPTPLVAQIQVAEQVFQGGRMFWLQPNLEIWVMINAPGATDHGQWRIFEDTFVEGEAEIDPDLTPPVDGIQPRRGFGKLWREHSDVREAVGWGITPEFGFVTTYEYRAGGYLDSEGRYVPGPGTHLLTSLGNETFAFEEADMTWRLVGRGS